MQVHYVPPGASGSVVLFVCTGPLTEQRQVPFPSYTWRDITGVTQVIGVTQLYWQALQLCGGEPFGHCPVITTTIIEPARGPVMR